VDVEGILRRVNLRKVLDPRRAFWPAFRVTGISGDWYGSTLGAVANRLAALGTVAQPMCESQTHSERCRVLMDIDSKECRGYLRFSRWTRSIRIPSMYDAWIIVHYQLLNYTIVPTISSTFSGLHHYIQEEPKKVPSDSKMNVGKTKTIIRLSDRNDINRIPSECPPLDLSSHQGR
jgi:hypothetical protein